MKFIPNWRRTLTHGHCSWAIYTAVTVEFLTQYVGVISELVPWYAVVAILAGGLFLRLRKQDAVSGREDE